MTPPARTAEHDAFGPWIDTVRTIEEVPRLYRPHGVDPFAARLVLKVPRDIPRRDTDPTMDLYDHLLVVGDDALEVLSRTGSAYTARRIPFADLVAVRDRVDLLDGLLTVHTSDGAALRIPFNGASVDAVVELTELLMTLAGESAGAPRTCPAQTPRATPRIDMGQDEAGVAAAYWELAARDPQLRYLSSRPRTPLVPTAEGLAGALQRLRPMSLAGAVAACSPRELLILTRRDPVLRRRTATLSIDRLRILRHAITSTTAEPHTRWLGMSTVTIRAGAASFEVVAASADELECDLVTGGS
ncbi:hypothetical protein [Clavibacter michiganensis]|uniref:Uncharacterized protein n=1 Tax=Clavibacter michiganensis TaxID=28447 RepID=A0A251YJH2_9MICO|nr:hypothetical protein [Clavibacter michiganensis]OUE24401.1 hypothetical protein BFL37_10845 [Clavibacter michiganensis]